MEQEHLGVLHTGGGDAGNQWAVEGGCKNVKIGGRVEVGEVRSHLGLRRKMNRQSPATVSCPNFQDYLPGNKHRKPW